MLKVGDRVIYRPGALMGTQIPKILDGEIVAIKGPHITITTRIGEIDTVSHNLQTRKK